MTPSRKWMRPDIADKYYDSTIEKKFGMVEITITPGEIKSGYGTSFCSVFIFSKLKERYLTDDERVELIEDIEKCFAKAKEDIKKKQLVKKLANI